MEIGNLWECGPSVGAGEEPKESLYSKFLVRGEKDNYVNSNNDNDLKMGIGNGKRKRERKSTSQGFI